MLDWLDQRAREVDEAQIDAIMDLLSVGAESVPELQADEDMLAETRAAARELTRLNISSVLPGVEPLAADDAPAVLISVVRTWARRGIDLRVLLRGYRRSQRRLWSYWMTDVTARVDDPVLRAAILSHSWERMSVWQDAQLESVEAIYGEERDRWLRGAHARRAEVIRSLLAGEPVGGEQAAMTLGYDLRRVHTALVLWIDGEESDALGVLEESARALARAVGGPQPLMLAAGSAALWAWIATDTEPDRSAWRAVELHAAVRVAAGRPARGVDGFRTSHQDAHLVRRQMPLAGRPGPLAEFDDVALACLMAGEPEAMRRVVAHELGGLARRDAATARLRETVRVYLECGGNAREAAERLSMHKNTVHYRLARVEELRGRPVGERRLEFEVALMLAHVFGDRVLPDQSPPGRA